MSDVLIERRGLKSARNRSGNSRRAMSTRGVARTQKKNVDWEAIGVYQEKEREMGVCPDNSPNYRI